MKFQIVKVLSFLVILSLSFSCIDENEEYTKMLDKWKIENENYFTNMKDSTSFKIYNIPLEHGGGKYYYKIINKGDTTSVSPILTDLVTVNYRGMFIDGGVFDYTYNGTNPVNNPTAKPVEFTVNNLITGWSVNLTQMKSGEVRTIVLPYNLAYGVYGVGSILPYSTLRFDIQLVSIKK